MYELVLILCLARAECMTVTLMDQPREVCVARMLRVNSAHSRFRRAWVDGWAPGTTHLRQPAFCLRTEGEDEL